MHSRSLLGLTLFVSIVCLPIAAAASDAPLVNTRCGPVRGTVKNGVREFLGIPYAAPPIAKLRWKAPQPHAAWTADFDATRFGNSCAQVGFGRNRAQSSEDCLFLNVYSPDPAGSGLPVMVWIHGGTFLVGSGSSYDGSGLAKKGGLIIVTINYRLGALGFLAHHSLDAESAGHASGNYGLLDQQAAIRWVKDNIAGFGGDPKRITIAGESAGAMSVGLQLVSPAASGLFERAIIESGPFLRSRPIAEAEKRGDELAAKLGCDKAPDIAGCMRAKSTEQVLSAIPASPVGQLVWSPVVDGHLIPDQPVKAFAAGKFNQVPVINGSNHDEGTLFIAFAKPVNPEEYTAAVRGRFPAKADRVLAAYPVAGYSSPSQASAAGFGDVVFSCPILKTGELLAAHVPVYQYEFNDVHAPNLFLAHPPFPMGAFHGSEIQYVFETSMMACGGEPAFSPQQKELSQAMMDYWIRFVTSGDPGGTSPRWEPLKPGNGRVLSLAPGAIDYESGFSTAHHCDLWDSIAP